MALIALGPGVPSDESLCGVVGRSRRRAGAILVRSDLKGRGLGTALMAALIEYARSQEIGELFGIG